ncbi:MAG: DMT family transporter [Candidatus Nitrosotenuis sp.]|nr:MAG: DMT family transporter [Candidatus Nitrosotenuis sp.]
MVISCRGIFPLMEMTVGRHFLGVTTARISELNRNSQKKIAIGIGFALLAAGLEALGDVLPKPMMASEIPSSPFVLVFISYLANGILFTPFAFSRKNRGKNALSRRSMSLLIIVGVIEVFSTIFFFYGLKETTAINAKILLNSEIVFGIIIALTFLGERLKKIETLPLSLIIIGAVLVPFLQDGIAGKIFSTNILGDSFVLISGLLLGTVVSLYKYISDSIRLSQIMQITSFVGAGACFITMISLGIPIYIDSSQIPGILFVGIFGIGIAAVCYISAMKHIGAVNTILVFSSTTVFGTVFSNLLLAENILVNNIISIGFIIVGIIFLRKKVSD